MHEFLKVCEFEKNHQFENCSQIKKKLAGLQNGGEFEKSSRI